MSARKRHTETLDFMRTFVVAERTGHWGDLFGSGYREMVDKLIKRGWIERTRSAAYNRPGSWRLNMQRRNSLKSTARGRRVIYRLDRHTEPHLRPHSWGTSHGYRSRAELVDWQHSRRLERLSATSALATALHSTRPGAKS
jgi:DNA-binding MarR family transcriptional regulator